MTSRLSPHFRREEFDCKDGTRAKPSPELIRKLEVLRGLCGGRPLYIVSGFRTASWNARVGGARNSQHLHNRAADIPSGYATPEQALAAGFHGVGTRGGWVVHVDVRPTVRPVVFQD